MEPKDQPKKEEKKKEDKKKEEKKPEVEPEVKYNFVKDETDPLKDKYGRLPFIQSSTDPEHRHQIKFDVIQSLNSEYDGKEIKLRARLQRARIKGKGGFIVLREGVSTVQGCMFVLEGVISKQMLTFVNGIHLESIVEVTGKVKKVEKPIESCTQKDVEIDIQTIFLVVDAISVLPFQMEDACRKVDPSLEEDDYKPEKEEKKDNILNAKCNQFSEKIKKGDDVILCVHMYELKKRIAFKLEVDKRVAEIKVPFEI